MEQIIIIIIIIIIQLQWMIILHFKRITGSIITLLDEVPRCSRWGLQLSIKNSH